jgi:hypothetical protein
MAINIKRSVHFFVKVDASFKKNYILFLSKLMDDLKQRVLSLTMSLKTSSDDLEYSHFVSSKRHETKLQIDQLKQQIAAIKQAKIGDRFKLSTLDGFSALEEGQSYMSVVSPVVVDIEDQTITSIST